LGGTGQAAEDVAAADHDADLDAAAANLRDLIGDERADGRIDAVRATPEEGLARQLQEDSPVAGRAFRVTSRLRAVAHLSSPSAKRTNRRTWMFSPIVAIFSVTSSRTLRSSSRNGCSSRTTSLNHFLSWPSTIFSRISAGLLAMDASLARTAASSARLAASSSAGIASVSTQRGDSPATWIASILTRSWNWSVRATKSVSQLTSMRTPTRPPVWM